MIEVFKLSIYIDMEYMVFVSLESWTNVIKLYPYWYVTSINVLYKLGAVMLNKYSNKQNFVTSESIIVVYSL